jgi:hypothetical protein
VPAIGAGDPLEVGHLSRSAEMAPWSVGGDYDRPLPRRIVEEAGVPRTAFAQRKLMVTPSYDALGRGRIAVDGYLSPASHAAFQGWLAAHRPFSRWQARVRNKVAAIVGRRLWRPAIRARARRLGLAWPPWPARVWHFRTPIRDNAFLVQWAMEQSVAALTREIYCHPAVVSRLTAANDDPTAIGEI